MRDSTVVPMTAQARADSMAAVISRLRNGEALHKLAPLDRRLGNLSEEEVRLNQRWRLLGATAHVISRRGYWPTTVGEICTIAKVSKKAFYQHFSSKEEAFLSAYEAVDAVRDEVVRSLDNSSVSSMIASWIDTYLGLWELEPDLVQMLLFQPMAATPAIRDCCMANLQRHASRTRQLLDEARAAGLSIGELSDQEIAGMLGGIGQICVQHVHAHGIAGIRSALSPTLQSFMGRVLRP